MMKFTMKLSDRILIIVVAFATLFVLFAIFWLKESLQQVIIMGGVLYVISFLVTYFISRSFSNRIVELTFRVEEMAAGNLSKRLPEGQADEIGQLTRALNELLHRLQTGIAQDISKHHELSKAKTDFVTLASHQLRTPLSIIKWYIDFLICGDAGELMPEQLKYLKQVYKSNERLIELVNALLDVSRIDVGTFSIEPEPIDIIPLAEEALSRLKDEIEKKKIRIDKHLEELPIVNADPRLTKIVFVNLLTNAVKYTPEGGRIQFIIKKTETDIWIKISDTGVGIPRAQQAKVFTKLFRAENAKRLESVGTGLGLYIVKAVIEKSGGKIWFQSPALDLLMEDEQKTLSFDKKNLGTTFNITIPLKGMRAKQGTKKLTSVS
jgi:signal transduction histidine kinase